MEEALSLIRKGDVDILDGEGRTPLIHAVFAGKNEIVSATLAAGANINHQDRNGWTPLHFAVQEKRRELVEYLLAHGALTDLKDGYGNTALWRATFDAQGDYGLVRLLVSHNADPNSKNNSGVSPLDFAIQVADGTLIAILKSSN